MNNSYTYVGSELELFAAARNWKSYFRSRITPYLGQTVLEVGAGLGGTTRLLCRGRQTRWVCLEPDPELANLLRETISGSGRLARCEVTIGTLDNLPPSDRFETLIYIDVLEHIADDAGELQKAAQALAPGGHLIVLSPAHNWLYTPFDQAIGHHRRYTRRSLAQCANDQLEVVRLDYLDSVGMLASLANRVLLQSSMPSSRQIATWDNLLVRLSRVIDPMLGYRVGKSVLGIWQKKRANRELTRAA